MTTFNLTCEAVEATLPDYLDESLEAWVRESIDEHLGECVRCAGLVRDLRNMGREAATLPALLPERELWPEVAQGIGAPVNTSGPVPEAEPLIASSEPPLLERIPLPISEPSLLTSEPSLVTSEPTLPASELSLSTSELSLATSNPSLSTAEPSLWTAEPSLWTAEPSLWTAEPSPTTESPPTAEPPPTTEPSRPNSEPSVPAGEQLLPSAAVPMSTTAPAIALPERREKRVQPAWMGLAAAALVLVTAGTTFLLTVRWIGPPRTPQLVTDTVSRRVSSSVKLPVGPGILAPSAAHEQIASDSSALTPPGPLGSSLAVATTSASRAARSPDEVVYDKEINMLQAMTRRRKAELDAPTAAVIERNLRIIDSNIAQIRAALQKDPGSSLLGDQVSRALDMKVELLRRVAMLRSNT